MRFFSSVKLNTQRWSPEHKAQGQGHKKFRGQGQGQPFRGQTLSRPRTGMLEAKDHGHRRNCSQKKKIFFSGDLQKKVFKKLLLELRSTGFYVQAYADDLAVLVLGIDMLWIRGMAQKAINIAANWASEHELQFSCKKTEIVLFTLKRNPDLGSLSINGSKLELSKEARLLVVTLDSKLTWKPHITRITRKATTALMQCRQIVGKTWGIKPSLLKWIYTAMIRLIMSYAFVSWAGGLNKKYLVRKLTKVQRLACLMISSAFLGTPTGALEILLNITPIEEFLLAEAVRGSYRITIGGLWHVNRVGSFGKTKCHGDVCNKARKFLSLLQMPADRVKKTKVFERYWIKSMLSGLKAF